MLQQNNLSVCVSVKRQAKSCCADCQKSSTTNRCNVLAVRPLSGIHINRLQVLHSNKPKLSPWGLQCVNPVAFFEFSGEDVVI